ncbi:MAG: hypothetical protein ACXW2U_06800 [Telluria sp.]
MSTMTGNGGFKPRQTVGKSMIPFVAATALLLLLPLVAMQFTSEVNWTAGDFAAAAALLLGTAFVYVLASRKVTGARTRLLVGAGCMFVLLVVWAELAVGIFS